MKIGKIGGFLVGLIFVFLLGSRKVVFAGDCVCQTVKDGDERKCEIVASKNNCKQGETATCQYNLDGACNHNIQQGASCICLGPGGVAPVSNEGYDEFCVQQGFGPTSANPKISTALGCIPVRMKDFVTWLMPYMFGIAGGVSFLMMVMGFISIATSGGDPKVMAEAREKITSAITGLLVSIFAIFLLRLIAIDILKIPGFN